MSLVEKIKQKQVEFEKKRNHDRDACVTLKILAFTKQLNSDVLANQFSTNSDESFSINVYSQLSFFQKRRYHKMSCSRYGDVTVRIENEVSKYWRFHGIEGVYCMDNCDYMTFFIKNE